MVTKLYHLPAPHTLPKSVVTLWKYKNKIHQDYNTEEMRNIKLSCYSDRNSFVTILKNSLRRNKVVMGYCSNTLLTWIKEKNQNMIYSYKTNQSNPRNLITDRINTKFLISPGEIACKPAQLQQLQQHQLLPADGQS